MYNIPVYLIVILLTFLFAGINTVLNASTVEPCIDPLVLNQNILFIENYILKLNVEVFEPSGFMQIYLNRAEIIEIAQIGTSPDHLMTLVNAKIQCCYDFDLNLTVIFVFSMLCLCSVGLIFDFISIPLNSS